MIPVVVVVVVIYRFTFVVLYGPVALAFVDLLFIMFGVFGVL